MKEVLSVEWARKLRDALLSGQYQQATGVLRKSEGCFCAEGVLADLVKDKVGLTWYNYDHRWALVPKGQESPHVGSRILLPFSVREITGDACIYTKPGRRTVQAIQWLNDSQKMTFQEIAECLDVHICEVERREKEATA